MTKPNVRWTTTDTLRVNAAKGFCILEAAELIPIANLLVDAEEQHAAGQAKPASQYTNLGTVRSRGERYKISVRFNSDHDNYVVHQSGKWIALTAEDIRRLNNMLDEHEKRGPVFRKHAVWRSA